MCRAFPKLKIVFFNKGNLPKKSPGGKHKIVDDNRSKMKNKNVNGINSQIPTNSSSLSPSTSTPNRKSRKTARFPALSVAKCQIGAQKVQNPNRKNFRHEK
jgi:hypothetical protein